MLLDDGMEYLYLPTVWVQCREHEDFWCKDAACRPEMTARILRLSRQIVEDEKKKGDRYESKKTGASGNL